jgi:hypothetical protein
MGLVMLTKPGLVEGRASGLTQPGLHLDRRPAAPTMVTTGFYSVLRLAMHKFHPTPLNLCAGLSQRRTLRVHEQKFSTSPPLVQPPSTRARVNDYPENQERGNTTRTFRRSFVWLCQSPQSFLVITLDIFRALRANLPTHSSFGLLPCCGGVRSGGIVGFVAPGEQRGGTGSLFSLCVVGESVVPRG